MLLFAAAVINYIDRGSISVALPLVAHDLRFGPELKGVLLSAFFWSYALMQVPVGWATDYLNLRWFFVLMFLIWSLAQGLTGIATTLGVLIGFRILLGIGESVYMPGGVKIISLLFTPAECGGATGFFHCGSFLGIVIGAPLTALLITRYGWHTMFPIVGLIPLPWLVAWLLTYPSHLSGKGSRGSPEPREQRHAGAIAFDRNLAGICVGQFASGYFWFLLITWLPDYLVTARHLRLLTAGFFSSLPFLVFAVAEPLGGWFADKLVRRGHNETIVRKSIVSCTSLFALLMLPATRVVSPSSAIWLTAGAMLVGLGWAQTWVFPQACAPRDKVGAWSGVANLVANLGGIVAPLATGFLVAHTGSYTPAFTLGAVVWVAGGFSYWFFLGDLKPYRAAEAGGVHS